MIFKTFAAVATCCVLGVSSAHATTVDLINENTGTINGAIFEWTPEQPTGTGVIDPFLTIGANDREQGYNTSAPDAPFDVFRDIKWTHDLLLNSVPTVTIGGSQYLKFLLDINQSNANKIDGNLLTMSALQIYLSDTPSQSTTDLPSLGYELYNMGDGNSVLLDAARNSGSGSGDMFAYIPYSGQQGDHVYLYSAFTNSNDGFEEWATVGAPTVPVPEPGTVTMLAAGLFGLAIYGKRRRNA